MKDDNAEAELREVVAERNAILNEKPPHPWRKALTWYGSLRQPRVHPLTGDVISPGESVTWKVMAIYRRWTVFILLQVLTIVWLSFPQFFPGGQFGWNLVWSDLAVMVEMLVGIAFMNQSLRDAKIIRASLKELQEQHQCTQDILADQNVVLAEMREVHNELARHLRLAGESGPLEGSGELGSDSGDDGPGGLASVAEVPEDPEGNR